MTTIAKYKRRTFKEVAAEAYAKGFSEGRKEARMDAQSALAEVSLRQLVWSRITGLFRGRS